MSGLISTLVAGTFSTTPSTDLSMGSATYTAGRWYVIVCRNRRTISTAFPPTITGGSISWDAATVADQAIIWNSNNECITTLFGFCSVTETATLHLTWTDAQTTATYWIGVLTQDFTIESVAALIAQSNHLNDSTSTTPSLAYSNAFANVNNVVLAIASYAAVGTGQTLTKDPNLTNLATVKASGVQVGYLDVSWKATEEATVDWTKTNSTASTQVIFELRIAPPPRSPIYENPVRPQRWWQGWTQPNTAAITPLSVIPAPGHADPNPTVRAKAPVKDWVTNNAIALIGQDKIFGGPGKVPTYDWPNPTLRARAPVQDWIQPRDVAQYVDTMYGAQGQVPARDLNPPTLRVRRPVQDHIGPNLVYKELAIAPVQDISPPVLRPRRPVQDWVRTDAFWLRGQDTQFGGPGQVFSIIINNPVLKRYPLSNITWLSNRDNTTPLVPQVTPNDYPNPLYKPFPTSLRTWVWNGTAFFALNIAPTYHFNNPVLMRRAQQPQLVGNQLVLSIVNPQFRQYDWPLPRRKYFPTSLLTYYSTFPVFLTTVVSFDPDAGVTYYVDPSSGLAVPSDPLMGVVQTSDPLTGDATIIWTTDAGVVNQDIPPSGESRYKPV